MVRVGADCAWVGGVVGFDHSPNSRTSAEGEGGVVEYGVVAV